MIKTKVIGRVFRQDEIADQIYDLVPEQARKKEASASVFLSVSSCYAYGHSYGPLQT